MTGAAPARRAWPWLAALAVLLAPSSPGCAPLGGPTAITYNDRLITVSSLHRLEVPPDHSVVYEDRGWTIRGVGRIKINGKLVWVEGETVHVDGSRFDVGPSRSVHIDEDGRIFLGGPR